MWNILQIFHFSETRERIQKLDGIVRETALFHFTHLKGALIIILITTALGTIVAGLIFVISTLFLIINMILILPLVQQYISKTPNKGMEFAIIESKRGHWKKTDLAFVGIILASGSNIFSGIVIISVVNVIISLVHLHNILKDVPKPPKKVKKAKRVTLTHAHPAFTPAAIPARTF